MPEHSGAAPENLGKSGEQSASASQQGDDYDWTEALRAVQGNEALLKIVMETFLEEAPSLRKRIFDAVEQGDAAALKIAAHTLKGSFRYLGLPEPFEQAFALEKLGKEGDLAGARKALPAIEEQIARVSRGVTRYLKNGN